MPADGDTTRSDNFFGVLMTERCECGHYINVTDPEDHSCNVDCDCGGCGERISRQLMVLEED